MSHSLYTADRRIHVKIIVVGLLCGLLVAAVGMFAEVSSLDLGTAPLVKATHSPIVAGRLPSIR